MATIASPADAADLRELFEAGPNGGSVDEVGYQVVGTGTQAASLVYVWKTDNTGANAEIVNIFTVAAGSAMTNTVKGQTDRWYPNYENLDDGVKIFITVSVLSTNCEFVVFLNGGQFEAQ